MASTKMKVHVRKKTSSTSVSKTISKEASPDSKCPICLDQFRNISYVDKCLHRFCFRCIHEWSKNKAECPLCKQPFSSIYHSIKAEDDFKQFALRPADNGSFGSLAGQRFRYRTTLTGDRRASTRRTSPPPDHGVMFEGLAGAAGHGNDRGFRRMLARLAARQRTRGENRTLRTPREQEMICFRRTLYRRGLWVRGVRDGGRSRDTSAEFFRRNPACLHRLVPWLKRELTVLYGTHGSLVNIVQHIVMSQITRYDMQDTAVLQELRPFLLSRTEHFLHEFLSFSRSPFNMEAYDQHAVYDCPAPSAEDSSSSDPSVIALSEDEGAAASQTGSSPAAALSQAAWDDETPGPSYSSESPRVFTLPTSDSDTDSSAEEAGPFVVPPALTDANVDEEDVGGEDCVIVGYVKPTAERTPELVQLSSDSEESVQEEQPVTLYHPLHIRFISEPTSPASNQSEPSCLASNQSEPSGSASSSSAAKVEQSRVCRTSPQTSSKARPVACSVDCYTPSKRQKSSKNRQCEVDDYRRHHSKKMRKDRSRSRNRDREHSSSHHRRRSHSWSPHSRESVQAKVVSGSSLSSRATYTHHSYERDRSRRYHTHQLTSRSHASPGHRSRPPSCSHFYARSRSWSRAHSQTRLRARSRTWSRERSRSWSHLHTSSRSRSHPRSCSRARSRSRSRPHPRSWSRARSRSRPSPRSWSRARSRSRPSPRSWSRARSRSRPSPRSWSRARSRSRPSPRSCSRARSHSKSWSRGSHSRLCRRKESRCRNSSPSSHRSSHKPSGKRKCKLLHTEQPTRDEASVGSSHGARRSREEHHKKLRRRRKSPSVEIVYEGGATERSGKFHRKKKKRKKSKRRRRKERSRNSPSPTIITIPSETEEEGPATNLSTVTRVGATNSAHEPPHTPAEAQLLSTTPAVPAPTPLPANAPEPTIANNHTVSPLPPGGALQPVEQQTLMSAVYSSADEPQGDFSSGL